MELIIISIALVLGIIWGLYFNISIALFLPCILMVILFIRKQYKKYLIIFIITILFSNIYISVKENNFNTKYKDVKGEVSIIGTIVSEPKIEKYSTELLVEVESINNDSKYKNTKILVNINSTYSNCQFGNIIEFNGELKDASSARNEGGFNYKEYVKTKGIYKTIFIKKNQVKIIKEKNTNIIEVSLYNIRNSIRNSARKLLPEKEANFLIAILIGNKQDLDESIEKNFRKSSLSHVLALSGMHVSYILFGVAFILERINISKKCIKIFLISFLIFFMILTGNTPSVQRACIMAIYLIVGSLLHRRTNTLNSIAFSNIVLLIINPYNILDIGYILSFGGTIGIVLIFPKLKRFVKKRFRIKYSILEKILDIMLVTLSANLILMPINLLFFNKISTVFVISNVLVSFLIGITLILGFAIIILTYIFFPLASMLSLVEKIFIDIMIKMSEFVGNMPLSQIYFIQPKFYMIVLYYILLFLTLNVERIRIFS